MVLKFEVVQKQFSQIFAVIVIEIVNVFQEKDHPLAEVHPVFFAKAQHGIHDCCIFSDINISTEHPVFRTRA